VHLLHEQHPVGLEPLRHPQQLSGGQDQACEGEDGTGHPHHELLPEDGQAELALPHLQTHFILSRVIRSILLYSMNNQILSNTVLNITVSVFCKGIKSEVFNYWNIILLAVCMQ
jgi:hypothetical protein